MSQQPLASIIVNNYNYGRFLSDAIDSALAQTYANTEVIVVDDGSTDDSREVIARYGARVLPVLKANGGQASAFNAGFAASRGEVVLFLDADDLVLPKAIENGVRLFDHAEVVKVHWPLWVIDQHGNRTGDTFPGGTLPEGDLRESARRDGPDNFAWPPTSGNLWSRTFLEQIFPAAEAVYRRGADTYLVMLAPLFGIIRGLSEPQSLYRRHGRNNWWSGMTFAAKIKREVGFFDHYSLVGLRYCEKIGVRVDAEAWQANSWWHRLRLAVEDLEQIIPAGAPFILVDDDTWGMDVDAVNQPIPFLERDGVYWGPPPDDATAIRELERLRKRGAAFIVFAWSAFWWLEHYAGLTAHLRAHCPCRVENDRLVVFNIR